MSQGKKVMSADEIDVAFLGTQVEIKALSSGALRGKEIGGNHNDARIATRGKIKDVCQPEGAACKFTALGKHNVDLFPEKALCHTRVDLSVAERRRCGEGKDRDQENGDQEDGKGYRRVQ